MIAPVLFAHSRLGNTGYDSDSSTGSSHVRRAFDRSLEEESKRFQEEYYKKFGILWKKKDEKWRIEPDYCFRIFYRKCGKTPSDGMTMEEQTELYQTIDKERTRKANILIEIKIYYKELLTANKIEYNTENEQDIESFYWRHVGLWSVDYMKEYLREHVEKHVWNNKSLLEKMTSCFLCR